MYADDLLQTITTPFNIQSCWKKFLSWELDTTPTGYKLWLVEKDIVDGIIWAESYDGQEIVRDLARFLKTKLVLWNLKSDSPLYLQM